MKDTQEPIEQYLTLQEHRKVSVGDLHSCNWIVDNNCICATSAPKDAALDSEDFNSLKSVYEKLLGLDETTIIEMPFTIAEFKSIRVGPDLYGKARQQEIPLFWQTGQDLMILDQDKCQHFLAIV